MRIATVLYSSRFKRNFKKLPRQLRLKVFVREKWFRNDCFDPRLRTHKLSGKMEGEWTFSLTQKYRVIFRFITDFEVVFDDIGDHTVYK